MKIDPGILTDSFLVVQNSADHVRMSPLVDALHIDVIDGQFAENFTVTPLDLTVGEFEPAKLDFHLMTEEPMDYVFECEGVKEYLPIRRIIGQVERMSHQADFLHEVTVNGWEAALALDLYTPVEAIDEEVWPQLKFLLLMSVEAGFSDQTFHNSVYTKIREIRDRFSPHQLNIIVDGGVKHFNATQLAAAGVNEAVATSALWESADPLFSLEEFYKVQIDKSE
jgi:ribulose-phosphate 3-epimerase